MNEIVVSPTGKLAMGGGPVEERWDGRGYRVMICFYHTPAFSLILILFL
jgi:hypothetical protein